MNELSITVLIPTLSSGPLLGRCLHSLKIQTNAPSEIVIITNSTNAERISRMQDQFKFSILIENRLGLSHARNAGINGAKSELIAFIDDDAIADKNWISCIKKRFSTGKKIGIIGGKILPIWNKYASSYVKNSTIACEWLSLLDLGDRTLSTDRVFGCNLSLRKDIIQKVGTFNPRLGRQPGTQLGGEETDFCLRAKQSYQVVYDPQVIVYHHITHERTTLSALLRRAFDGGFSKSLQNRSPRLVTRRSHFNFLDTCLVGSYIIGYSYSKINFRRRNR